MTEDAKFLAALVAWFVGTLVATALVILLALWIAG